MQVLFEIPLLRLIYGDRFDRTDAQKTYELTAEKDEKLKPEKNKAKKGSGKSKNVDEKQELKKAK